MVSFLDPGTINLLVGLFEAFVTFSFSSFYVVWNET